MMIPGMIPPCLTIEHPPVVAVLVVTVAVAVSVGVSLVGAGSGEEVDISKLYYWV